jgi:hypothetical protein
LLEKYSRSVEMSQHFSAHESADELKTRLVSLFRIKDEVEEMLNYNSMQKPDDEMIGPDDVNLDLLPNRFRSRCSVSSAGEYETDIGKLRNRDAELAEMEFKLGQKQSISSENDDGMCYVDAF